MSKKISYISLVLILSLVCSSFTLRNSKFNTCASTEGDHEEAKVREFVDEKICLPISITLEKKITGNAFSRCISGYFPYIESKDVKTNSFVCGKITFNNGCSSKLICEFIVHVNKGYALVRSAGTTKYMSVKEWLKSQKQGAKSC